LDNLLKISTGFEQELGLRFCVRRRDWRWRFCLPCLSGPDVALFVVGYAISPATKEDSNPLEGQDTDGGVMTFAAST
jgi:hypothetical protein